MNSNDILIYFSPFFIPYYGDPEFKEDLNNLIKTDKIIMHSINLTTLSEFEGKDEYIEHFLNSPEFFSGAAAQQFLHASELRNTGVTHLNLSLVGLTSNPQLWVDVIRKFSDIIFFYDIPYTRYTEYCKKYNDEPISEEDFVQHSQYLMGIVNQINGIKPENAQIH